MFNLGVANGGKAPLKFGKDCEARGSTIEAVDGPFESFLFSFWERVILKLNPHPLRLARERCLTRVAPQFQFKEFKKIDEKFTVAF